jgi:hypothetical protein
MFHMFCLPTHQVKVRLLECDLIFISLCKRVAVTPLNRKYAGYEGGYSEGRGSALP